MKFGNLFAAKRRAIAWLMLGLFLGGVHAAETGVSDTEIVLGMDLALQGGKNNYGVAAAQGMKLYFDGVNASGGINGRKIVQRILDDDNKAANAEANARKLVQDGAFILFSAIDGGPSTAVMKVASELKVPFLAQWPAHRYCVGHTSRWYFPCVPSTRTNFAP